MAPDLNELLKELNYKESEICEFKVNNYKPELIGESLSALSNSGTVVGTNIAYLMFGIDDNGKIVGTKFNPDKKYNNQELRNWLTSQLKPATRFEIDQVQISSKKVVIFSIEAATAYPVRFKGQARIRVGSYSKLLADHPDIEKILWQNLDRQTFETRIASDNLSRVQALKKLDYQKYFELKKTNINSSQEKIA